MSGSERLRDDRNGAVISDDGQYRYRLSRTWDVSKPTVAFVMLNPSTADATEDDPTIRRCIGYAREWGYGRLIVGNLFAVRETDPANLYDYFDPIGPENDRHLQEIAEEVDKVIAAWGANGDLGDRGGDVARVLDEDLYALDTTKDGHPVHPLYQPSDAEPEPWNVRSLQPDEEEDLRTDGGTRTGVRDRSESVELHLQPVTEKEANAFIREHHETHDPDQGWKFGVGVNDGEQVVGVIKIGRPRSRHQDDGVTLEATRCATDGTKNVASKLYAAAWRAARNIGYRRLITYTLADSEDGTCLRAVNGYEVVHERTGGGDWSRPSRPRVDTSPAEQKTLWEVATGENIPLADGGKDAFAGTGSEHGGESP